MRWIFGYGSLIFRPAFEYAERKVGYVSGYARRFWQHSTDHRGTPARPGRVVTLIPADGERCFGAVYRVEEAVYDATMNALDVREQGGYSRRDVVVHCDDVDVPATLYWAGPGNPNYAGPAELVDIASVVRDAIGPSGANRDYVLALADALVELTADARALDAHTRDLAALVRTV